MPFIDVTIAQGRSPDEVRALMRELTAALVEIWSRLELRKAA